MVLWQAGGKAVPTDHPHLGSTLEGHSVIAFAQHPWEDLEGHRKQVYLTAEALMVPAFSSGQRTTEFAMGLKVE